VDHLTYQDVANLFGVANLDDFLADVGCGEFTTPDIAKRVLQLGKVEEPLKEVREELKTTEAPQKPARQGDGIAVMGAGNMLTILSRCCNPMPPDDIVGFVTRGRGVSVHRRECPNVGRFDRERMIKVDWGATPPQLSRVKIRVLAYDRAGLLKDIIEVLDLEKIYMEDASAVTARRDNLALITATLEVRDAEQLDRVLYKIGQVPNVREVRRQKG
jgi:GTP pyrophosphokinase